MVVLDKTLPDSEGITKFTQFKSIASKRRAFDCNGDEFPEGEIETKKKEEREMPIIDSVVLHHCNLQGSSTNVAPIVKTFKAECHFVPNCLNSDGSLEEGAFTTFS